MPIKIEPTMIKQSFYLLVPKNIASLVEIDEHTLLTLSIEKSKNKNIIKYEFTKV